MITVEQCRAARGLLGWTQEDLAKSTGLSKTAINNFERGTSAAKQDTLETIHHAFINAGIQFTDDMGVKKPNDAVSMFKGDNCNDELLEDIFATLKSTGGEILISPVDERRAYELYPERLMAHLQRMKDANITERMLCAEGDTFFLQPIECYRWVPLDMFTALTSTFVYGNKVALKLWENKVIVVINSKDAADAERRRFNHMWERAKIPTLEQKKTAGANTDS